jgi:glycosyltransferase involved in cell wall biosynthesis
VADPQQRIRILWLIKGLGPGGAEQLLVNQARVRDRDRFTVDAAYLVPWKHHLVPDLERTGVRVECLDSPRNVDLRWLARLHRRLRDQPVDVLHVHSPLVAAFTRVALRTIPRRRRPAQVYTEHNRWPRHSRATRLLNRLTYPLDDVSIAVSEDVRASIPSRLARRTEMLVHGVDVAALRAESTHREAVRAELGIAAGDVVVGIVANFRREKAYEVFLDAARRALDSGLPLRFVSVGQGPLEEEMRARLADLGLGDAVLLLGYRADAVRVMTAFDVFTLTSRHEGLPVSLMEALALGLPAVATEVGGVPQAVDDGVEGLLVPADDAGALARGYVTLAREPERRRAMGAAALRRSTEFDVRRAERRLEEIYTEVVDKRRR